MTSHKARRLTPAWGVLLWAAAAASGAGAQERSASTLEEIVVTAQRRAENLQEVPISITAVTGASLEARGLTTTDQLSNAVPGLTMTRQARGSQPYIRGVGSQSAVVGSEAAVSTYVDGVYYVDPLGSIFSFNGIERVEVLKGPQGTLFGRNATGGLIQVITRDPTTEPEVSGQVSYGNYETTEASALLSGGKGNLAAMVSGYMLDQNKGFGRYLINGADANYRKETALRAKVVWTPTDADKLTLSGDIGSNKSDIGLARQVYPGALLSGGIGVRGGFYDTQSGTVAYIPKSRNWGASIKYLREMDFATLTVLSAYRSNLIRQFYDNDSQPARVTDVDLTSRTTTLQNEIYLNGKTDRVAWTTGVFLFSSSAGADPLALGSSLAAAANTRTFDKQETKSYAAYAQSTIDLSDATSVTGGIRYTRDERHLSARIISAPGHPTAAGTQLAVVTPDVARIKYGRVTWRLAVDHKLSDDVMVYGSYNRGFKSGFFNLTSPTAPPVLPEQLDAFEVGFKSELLDNQLRFNASAFHYRYKDIQLITAGTVNGLSVTTLFNAAKGRVNGFEAEATFAPRLPTGNLTITGGLSVLDAKYTRFPAGPVVTPLPTGGGATVYRDLSGKRMIRSPKWTASAQIDYSVPVGENTAGAAANLFHSDGFFWEAANRIRQRPYDVVNASVYYAFGADQRYKVKLFANNVLGEKYYVYAAEFNQGDVYAPASPATYGVSLSFKLQP